MTYYNKYIDFLGESERQKTYYAENQIYVTGQ